MLYLLKKLFENPFFISIAMVAVGASIPLSLPFITKWPALTTVLTTLSPALMVAGLFSFIFELSTKTIILKEAIKHTVGLNDAFHLGIESIVADVNSIKYSDSIKNSTCLAISSRRSTVFLRNNQSEIIKRLDGKKKIDFIFMEDAQIFPSKFNNEACPKNFFSVLSGRNNKYKNQINLLTTNRILSYNFTKVDNGIWIKLYLNWDGNDSPPAFFVKKGSDLYKLYDKDIQSMMSASTKVAL